MALQKKTRLESGEQFAFVERGDKLKGHYVGTDEIETKYGLSKRHAINTKKGLVTFFGSAQVTGDLAEVPVGTYVEIELTGTKKTKRGTMKTFDFSYDLDNVDDGAGASARAGLNESEELGDNVSEDGAYSADEDDDVEEAPLPPSRRNANPATVTESQQARTRDLLSRKR